MEKVSLIVISNGTETRFKVDLIDLPAFLNTWIKNSQSFYSITICGKG